MVSRHVIDRFQIPQSIPVDGNRTYEELAAITKVPTKTLRRVLRHSMAQRVFCEPQPGIVAHTKASKVLAEDEITRDYFATICEHIWPAVTRLADAIEKWPTSNEKSETGYGLANGGKTIYQVLEENPSTSSRYNNAMGAWKEDASFGYEPLVKQIEWSSLANGLVVDIGGGHGLLSRALAKAFPSLNFIVEDLPRVVDEVSDKDDFGSRMRFVPHNFFEEQPIRGADVYVFRRVLMEWKDDQVIAILKALKPALKEGARIVVLDVATPIPGTGTLRQERKLRSSDMLAFAISNAGGRDVEGWHHLFAEAGPGFSINQAIRVPGSDMFIMEAIWKV